MPTRVFNISRADPSELESPDYVYCGRPSKWGNPYSLQGATHADRIACVIKFGAYLMHETALLASLDEVRGKRLGCWCAPLLCHCELIALAADSGLDALSMKVAELQRIIRR